MAKKAPKNKIVNLPARKSAAVRLAREVLEHEADALRSAARTLDDSFSRAVALIAALSPAGRVVISGVGKAGFIAMKISATLASVGAPSFYLHPAEAVHGDLGRYSSSDIALILSNSGETPEILRLLPHLKRVGCPVISITSSTKSTLSKHSDVVVGIGKFSEAGPLGLAPTTSTVVMLGIGDALAMSVAHALGVTRERFAQYHPGGDLGKSLTLVSEIMRTGDHHCVVTETMTGRVVLQRMMATKRRPGAATVIDSKKRLSGILTDGDIRRALSGGDDFLSGSVRDFMGKNPKTVGHSKLLEEALRIMSEHKFDELIVVDDEGVPVGMIDIQDIVALQRS